MQERSNFFVAVKIIDIFTPLFPLQVPVLRRSFLAWSMHLNLTRTIKNDFLRGERDEKTRNYFCIKFIGYVLGPLLVRISHRRSVKSSVERGELLLVLLQKAVRPKKEEKKAGVNKISLTH